MSDNIRHTGLCLQDAPVGSLGHGPHETCPSSSVQDVSTPRATWIPVVLTNNLLPLTAGTLLQSSETVENNSQGTVAHTDNPSTSTETPIDMSTLVQHCEHGYVLPGDAENVANPVNPQWLF